MEKEKKNEDEDEDADTDEDEDEGNLMIKITYLNIILKDQGVYLKLGFTFLS
jgi:hypothetical protein